jgi:hypothetical protein
MHQPGAKPLSLFGQHPRGQRVDGSCQIGLTLGLVHGGVSCRIHDHVGPYLPNGLGQSFGTGEVAAEPGTVEVQGHHLTQRRQAALQFPADLATFSKQEDFHAAYWILTQSR